MVQLFAIHQTNIHLGIFQSMLIVTLLIQAVTNMFNEYYDFKRGLDTKVSVGIGLVCMVVGYLYTGGPLPIAYTPFGEVVAGFFMGMGMGIILISFFIQTGNGSVQAP